jgi:hypothetical protein
MASNVNSSNINGAYPIAGQDNDTQGFRDNFTNIKNNLKAAAEEITDLQNKVVLRAPLAGAAATTNDFNGVTMTAAITAGFTESKFEFDNSTQSGPTVIDFNQGDNQSFQTAGPVSLSFANWPAASRGYAKIRVLIEVMSVAPITHTITLPATVSVGANMIAGGIVNPLTGICVITPTVVGHYLLEFSSFDGGNKIIVVPLVDVTSV